MKKVWGIFLLFIVCSSWGQEPFFKQFSMLDGLPSNVVYHIFQDQQGYLWFSTEAGVSRYDGNLFRTYTTEDGLSDTEVLQIAQDSRDRLWFLSSNGSACYAENGIFHNQENDSLLAQVPLNSILNSFAEDSSGNIYLSSYRHGPVCITKHEVVHYSQLELSNSHHLMMDAKGEPHLLGNNGLFKLAPGKDSVTLLKEFPARKFHLRKCQLNGQYFWSEGTVLHTLQFTPPYLDTLLTLPSACKNTIALAPKPNEDLIWAGTMHGVYLVDPISGEVKGHYLKKYAVTSVCEDHEGNIWFSTLKNGVFFISSLEILKFCTRDGLPYEKTTCLALDSSGNLWAGSLKNKFSILRKGFFLQQSLPGRIGLNVTRINHISKDETWVCGKSNVLRVKNGRWQYMNHIANDVLPYGDSVWIGTSSLSLTPLSLVDSVLAGQTSFQGGHLLKPFIKSRKKITRLVKGKPGEVWAGTTSGLLRIQQNVPQELPVKGLEGVISDLIYDSDKDLLFIATRSNGVFILKENTVIRQFSKKNGLSSNICTSLFKDQYDFIWVGTQAGLSVIKNTTTAENFNSTTSLSNVKINSIQAVQDTFYLATDYGILRLEKKLLRQRHFTIPLSIERLNEALVSSETVYLENADQGVTISYKGISFTGKNTLTYLYRLLPQHTVWQSTPNNSLVYNSLKPGKYTLEVKATTGAVESEVKAVAFVIPAQFWQTRWFMGSVTLLILTVTWLLYKWRIQIMRQRFYKRQRSLKEAKEKAEVEKRLVELERKALRLQMNPHFLYNALNTIKGYYAEEKPVEASRYISMFSKLLRLILEQNDKLISLEMEMEMLRYYIELTRLRYKNNFDFELTCSDQVLHKDWGIPPMLLQPFVENAIIHGLAPLHSRKGFLSVSITSHQDRLVCSIEDNGIGRQASGAKKSNQPHRSIATSLTEERLSILGPDVYDAEDFQIIDLAEGTRVVIKLPIQVIW